MLSHSILPSPLGALHIVTTPKAEVAALDFEDNQARLLSHLARHALTTTAGQIPPPIAAALKAYFEGKLEALTQIQTALHGTPFQQRVWRSLARIPPGQTRNYAQLAASLGQPGASRAVGLANGQNPVCLLIPCHRVIGKNGRLTGYAGGLSRKQWLLAHEGAVNPLLL